MKPLTLDELKALQVGDWVWVVNLCKHRGTYRKITAGMLGGLYFDKFFDYEQYGRLWTAYKNKEQAEAKGERVELPRIEPFETFNVETGEPCICYNVLYRDWNSGELVIDCEVDKDEAEALLEELRGEE